MPKKLPIGIQTFKKLREGDYLYIDKTKQIYNLITTNSVYFISRPRRFGKSLLISTLEEVFKGNKELFKGLDIYQEDYNWKEYPVIRISFGGNLYEDRKVLEDYVNYSIDEISKNYNIEISQDEEITIRLRKLIRKLSEIDKVVILIDEYDKPLIDNLTQDKKNIFIENREFLKAFYSVFKEMDEYLKFVLLTGVSKFSKAGVFSGLNQLQDITMDARFADLLGWTQSELEKNFPEEIKMLAKKENLDQKQTIEKIKHWYNGYQFSENGDKKVYNPFSSLLLFQKQKFSFHWFESGTPSFLINLVREKNYDLAKIENSELSENVFSGYEIENLNPLSLLTQTGYLTIKETFQDKYDDTLVYKLAYPNFEVKKAFLENLIKKYSQLETDENYINKSIRALEENKLDDFFLNLQVFFANIPYDLQLKKEVYYQTVFYCIFNLIGLKVDAEIKTNIGRIDALIEIENSIYIFEFKLNSSKEEALAQIKEKKYYEKFLNQNKKVYLVGVEFRFDDQEKNIGEWVVEEISG